MSPKLTGAISQPNYLPWLGYFEQILYSDIFIFLDNVQFPRREWCNRNRILNNREIMWLTVPIAKTGQNTNINKIKISYEEEWVKNHLKSIEIVYHKSLQFDGVFQIVKKELEKTYEYLSDLNIALIDRVCSYLEIKTKKIRASERNYSSKRTELLADICKNYEIDYYYTSQGAKVYLDKEISTLENVGISVEYQNYQSAAYNQIGSREFVPYLSIVDLLFNVPKEKAVEIIKAGALH